MKCQICYTDIGSLSLSDKQAHYEHHLHDSGVDASQIATSSRVSTKPDTSQNINEDPQGFKKANKRRDKWKPPLFSNLEKKQDVFWYPAMEEPPPDNFTPGIITLLKKALLKSHAQGITVRAVLSYERTTYINNQMWDMGWGCGYRNFLMASAALMDQPFQPMYFPLLDKPISPGIRNLQQWIEQAWKDGYDQEGYQQLHRLVETHKWIGTSDLCTAFVHRGIPAELADFQAEDDGDIRPLTKWIVDYFDKYKVPPSNSLHEALSGATPVHSVDCMPLILQNAGHSRLVVGYEMGKGGVINLLVFDPSIKPNKAIRKAALHAYSTQRNRDARSSLSSLGQKRRHSGEEIVFLGASNSTARKRLKGESNPRPPGDVDLLAEGDDDIVLLGERKRSNEKKTGASTRKIQEDDFLWKEVIKLCQWQGKKEKEQISDSLLPNDRTFDGPPEGAKESVD